ncbi:MAG: hypothetical protein WCF65_03260 [Parachlamydiaceae bacterium]
MINKLQRVLIVCLLFISFSELSAHPPKNDKDLPFYSHSHKARGFIGGAAGLKGLEKYAPTRTSSHRRLNQPLGQAKADKIAISLGLDKNLCFTEEQYLAFITGQGVDGSGNPADAKLVDESVKLLTNTCGNPLFRIIDGEVSQIILGSYGLIVNEAGMLESPANPDAPTRQVNAVIQPGGYMSTWCMANGAEASLDMLYRSVYPLQLPYAIVAQHEGTNAELALYLDRSHSAFTGMSMAPSVWEVNFCLIYMLNPKQAAKMPAYWTAIPKKVVKALIRNPNGQVPFSEYSSYFKYGKCKKSEKCKN